ncbi:MAG: hypothetical protein GX055_04030, partial [Desulfovibrionales bacterium]|nr:hypothetical protein [Desulfovibrionales bacterium]
CAQVVHKMLDCLRQGISDGTIRADLHPELAASVIFSTVFGSTRARLLVSENLLGLNFSEEFYPEIIHILRKYLQAEQD